MKLGIAGTGSIVQELLPQLAELKPGRTVIMGRESSRERTEALARQFNLDRTIYDYDALLGEDVDTVYVAIPNSLHYEYAKKALLTGKHVILEKPAAERYEELAELNALAEERGLFLLEAVSHHHQPAFKALREAIPLVGQPRLCVFYYCQRSRRYDDFLQGKIHPVFDPKLAGGVLMDLNIYNIHALVTFFGPPKGVDYKANIQRGVDTSGTLTLDYGDFKAVALAAKDCSSPGESVIMGEEGFLQMDLRRLTGYRFTSRTGEQSTVTVEPPRHRLLTEFMEFDRMVREGDRAEIRRLMDISLTAAKIIETARTQVGI